MTTPSPPRKKPPTAQLIEQMKPEIGRALPKHLSPDRMARIATTVLRQNPQLARCTPESFLGALMTASQLGLEPGPIGEAYLVPFGNAVTFIPGYRGLTAGTAVWSTGRHLGRDRLCERYFQTDARPAPATWCTSRRRRSWQAGSDLRGG